MLGFMSNIWNSIRGNAENYSQESIQQLNPKFGDFEKLSPEEQNNIKNSVFEKFIRDNAGTQGQTLPFGWDTVNTFSSYVYGGLHTSKSARLESYRRMTQFPEIGDAVDEICDASLNYDEDNDIIKMDVNETKIKDIRFTEIKEQYENYINLFLVCFLKI
jgi:hypothetical protein